MAGVIPFRALRPSAKLAQRVATLPYDVMDVPEARAMAAGNPDSFLHVSRPEIDLPQGTDPHDDAVYRRGRENLDELRRRGVLLQDDAPCFYAYRQQMGEVTQLGLVACATVDDYESGAIRRHEETRPDKELDRVRHIDALDAHDEPVFLLYRRSEGVESILQQATSGRPTYDFVSDDGIGHTLWVIDDAVLVGRLVALFADAGGLYVADGHHRSAAAGRVRDLRRRANPRHTGNEGYNAFLCVIFADEQLNVLAYNRVVADLNGLSLREFLSALAVTFTVQESSGPVVPDAPGTFGMYIDGRWFLLSVGPAGSLDNLDTVARLDVSVLQDRVLQPLLGVGNPRTDKRIQFVGGIRGVKELVRLVDSGLWAVAFSMYPTAIRDLIDVADQGRLMPPKSTWFEPKLRSGLFLHLLSDPL